MELDASGVMGAVCGAAAGELMANGKLLGLGARGSDGGRLGFEDRGLEKFAPEFDLFCGLTGAVKNCSPSNTCGGVESFVCRKIPLNTPFIFSLFPIVMNYIVMFVIILPSRSGDG